jgi:tRNA(His) 5'-end guanylyltransferase
MNAAARAVMAELPDITIAYGVSDEYRHALDPSRKSQHQLTWLVQLCFPQELQSL